VTVGQPRLATSNPYERLYRSQRGGLLWGEEPGRLVAGISQWAEPGTVVDAGCGDGKNALFLEQHGFRVLGFDCSRTALAALRRRAALAGHELSGTYVVADVEATPLQGAAGVDVLVSYGLYHCLRPQTRAAAHRWLQQLLAPNGVVLFCALTDGVPPSPEHFDTPVSLPSVAEIAELFKEGFCIEHWQCGSILEAHPPLVGWHKHEAVWVVARRNTWDRI
jgi:cyclopropane fatty-acyl-phospholipid synthase-like methyltransferase